MSPRKKSSKVSLTDINKLVKGTIRFLDTLSTVTTGVNAVLKSFDAQQFVAPRPEEEDKYIQACLKLGVNPYDDFDVMKDRYHEICKNVHPDKTSGKDTTEIMAEINGAWNVIKEKKGRK